MPNSTRPGHLPDFTAPPLNEVVLGVQFDPPRGYQQIRAYEVWQLFRDRFPNVEEQAPLAPSFEMFGLPARPQFGIEMLTGAPQLRFWFLSKQKDELIQFQSDRLLHNWRKVGDMTNDYPRFERMVEKFETELNELFPVLNSPSATSHNITQCEISYINHIFVEPDLGIVKAADVFRFMQLPGDELEGFSVAIARTISDTDQTPIGRLHIEGHSAIHNATGKRMFVLTITARGLPSEPTVEGAIEFLKLGREMVLNTFAEITTDLAHSVWGRTQ